MPVRNIGLLPEIFRTNPNEKFLNATIEQLTNEPSLKRVNGHIGKKRTLLNQSGDNYISEITADRVNYQLEPAITVPDVDGKPEFVGHYTDLLNKIRYYGGNVDDHSRLFSNEFYSYNGQIDYDKFVNFSQYYWVPAGPAEIDVYGKALTQAETAIVTRTGLSATLTSGVGNYQFSTIGTQANPILILVRGGTYSFPVNQTGNGFWIQTEAGTSGTQASQPNFSSREVFGVVNNGAETGTVTFNVPTAIAQEFYTSMASGNTVNFAAAGITYKEMQGSLLSTFLDSTGGIDGNKSIGGKTLLFVDNSITASDWTATNIYNSGLGYGTEFATDALVPTANRNGIWRVNLEDNGSGDFIIHLTSDSLLTTDKKSNISEGLKYNDRSYYKSAAGQLVLIPLITALQDTLYYQDANDSGLVGTIKLIEESEDYIIDIDKEILGRASYTSPNGITLTNGLKIMFNSNVTPTSHAGIKYIVEGVGKSITLTPVTALLTPESYVTTVLEPFDSLGFDSTGMDGADAVVTVISTPSLRDYITINRASIDSNPWSRSNRWVHIDVLTSTAKYNGFEFVVDQGTRAQRPIIEFNANLKLFNFGEVGIKPLDLMDSTQTDALSNVHGAAFPLEIDGINVTEGARVMFLADTQADVRKTIYVVESIDADNNATPEINLVPDTVQLAEGNSVLVLLGTVNKANTYYMKNAALVLAQTKTALQQQPKFDVFDRLGNNLADVSTYTNSSFLGTELFSYKAGTGAVDTVLGFKLAYRNFENVGDILFKNNFDSDKFTYTINNITTPASVNVGFLHSTTGIGTFSNVNVWDVAADDSNQRQLITYNHNGTSVYEIDISPAQESTTKHYNVYLDHKPLLRSEFRFTTFETKQYVQILIPMTTVTRIDIMIFSNQISTMGWYQIPSNLENNAQNETFSELTLGQLRNHVNEAFNNSNELVGIFPGVSNLRDKAPALKAGGNILQHSAGLAYANLFLLDKRANFVDATLHAQSEYARFKYKFMDQAITLDIDVNKPIAAVDTIIAAINQSKTADFPWYASDMVPHGSDKTTTTYTVVQTVNRDYELVGLYNSSKSGSTSVLIYVNGVQLVNLVDFNYNDTYPHFTILDTYNLSLADVITVVEYHNTTGNWIPETPTKLGLYPAFAPSKFNDTTFVTPIDVIQGHDGSITPAYNDFRDDLLLELEKRIFNNIKTTFDESRFSINKLRPGKFRNTDYSFTEWNNTLARYFFKFIGENKLDYRSDSNFDSANGFTYNYRNFNNKIDGQSLPGSWKATYNYYYDTIRPNITPWEMLGFSVQPQWWVTQYGPAPYSSGNMVLWNDLEAGRIQQGSRSGIDLVYARPGLNKIIPVDRYGELLNPDQFLVNGTAAKYANVPYTAGEHGPAEQAWRNSSQFPYALQIIIALLKPANYFGLFADIQNYQRDANVGQFLALSTNQRLKQTDVILNGEHADIIEDHVHSYYSSAGYINWIVDYIKADGISPTTYLGNMLTTYNINLAYKVAGFTDKKLLKVIAEQSSPSSSTSSVIIPDENFTIKLNTETPLIRISFSSVIIQKTATGYRVDGYNLGNPHFTIMPSIQNTNTATITVLDETITIYQNFSNVPVSVPYGYEFTDKTAVIDFMLGYGRFLERQGFLFDQFDSSLVEVKNWVMSSKEFLYWTQQGWGIDNVIVLNPAGDKVHMNTPGAVVSAIKQTAPASIADQNFKPIQPNNFTVKRIDNQFELSVTDGRAIGFLEISLVQVEHVIVFDNITVFNDTIYQAELGNRQVRLTLAGFVSNGWNGSLAPGGYIYSDGNIAKWKQETDYRRGDLVSYKSNFYVANKNLSGAMTFDYDTWSIHATDSFSNELVPNFSNLARKPEDFYEINDVNLEDSTDVFGKGLIGFRRRDYFNALGINDTSQVKFYQGMIQSKGTITSVNALTRARLKNDDSTINIFEEWALRVGEYGATDSTQVIETILHETGTTPNPVLLTFKNATDTATPGAVNVYPKDVYLGPTAYNKNLFITEVDRRGLDYTIQTAGPPALTDAQYTLFSWDSFSLLNQYVPVMSPGQLIWIAKDTTNDWNIYRITRPKLQVTSFTVSAQTITFETNKFHGLTVGQRVMVRHINSIVDSWYVVTAADTLNSFDVLSAADLTDYSGIQLVGGQLYTLASSRFANTNTFYTNAASDVQDGEKVFIDRIDTADNWRVLEKASPWTSVQRASPPLIDNNIAYGTSVQLSSNAAYMYSAAPLSGSGYVDVTATNQAGNYISLGILSPDNTNTSNFGYSMSTDTGPTLAIGAPSSAAGLAVTGTARANAGHVYIYQENTAQTSRYKLIQVIPADGTAANARFGSTVELSEDGHWLYVGEPGKNRVRVYSSQPEATQTEAVVATDASDPPAAIVLGFSPPSVEALIVTDSTGRVYVPLVDYAMSTTTVANDTITFEAGFVYPAAASMTITFTVNTTHYKYINDITTSAMATPLVSDYALSTNATGTKVVIGIDKKSSDNIGDARIYDRMLETVIATAGQTVYQTATNFQAENLKVLSNSVRLVETTNYTVDYIAGTVTLVTASTAGDVVTLETSVITEIQQLVPILTDAHADDLFGHSVDINSAGTVIAVGMPNFDNTSASDSNTGIVYQYTNEASAFQKIKGTVQNPTTVAGDSIRINNIIVSFTGVALADVIGDINSAAIPGITASDDDGYLVVQSNKVASVEPLTVLSGRTDDDLQSIIVFGFKPYPFKGTLLNPIATKGSMFGESVFVSSDANQIVVSSPKGTVRRHTTFDAAINETTLDGTSTKFSNFVLAGGSACIFEYLPVAEKSSTDPGSYIFAQELSAGAEASAGDQFGESIAVTDNTIVVGATANVIGGFASGNVYTFANSTKAKAWKTLRTRTSSIDTYAINQIYLYNKKTKTITKNLDFTDPVKGKILGGAEQEIDYRMSSDPAKYNVSTNPDKSNPSFYWNVSNVGRVWWDLSTVRYIDYEQGDIAYKSQNWGKLFPGSSIDVYEWVKTDVLPSEYIAAGYNGIPKDQDDSIYTLVSTNDVATGLENSDYYYWVGSRTEVDTIESPFRTKTLSQVVSMIANPKSQGLPYAQILDTSSMNLVNVSDSLTGSDIILHVDYDILANKDVIHSEYQLIQEGAASTIPAKIRNKIVDSLAGIDSRSFDVPNPALPVSQRTGTGLRPRQSMVVTRLAAVKSFILEVNRLLKERRIVGSRAMPTMSLKEEFPTEAGAYDEKVTTVETLQLVDVAAKSDGYKVLVQVDSTVDNFWVIYILSGTTWNVNRVQSYDTTRYWSLIDWYETGYTGRTVVDITVATRPDLSKIASVPVGSVIKVLNNNNSQWELLLQGTTGTSIIGVEKATVEINHQLYNPVGGPGFESTGFDLGRFDSVPGMETRNIITSVLTEIFIGDMATQQNLLFFTLVRYILSEQLYVDWIFKTSFVSATQEFSRLEEFPVFQKDNQTYLQDYINEIKPYHTKVREYLLNYKKLDTWAADVTDFDIPSYYDFTLNRFRSPNGEEVGDDTLLSTNLAYNQWQNNHKYYVSAVTIQNAGTSYDNTVPPIITISGGGGTGATASATTIGGVVSSITVTNQGSGYTSAPTVTFSTSSGTTATAYAQLANAGPRKLKTTIKFDRVSYGTTVKDWAASTTYALNDIVTYNGTPYTVTVAFTSAATFSATNLTIATATSFDNANDRTWAFYQPTAGMIGRELTQIFNGLAYTGVDMLGSATGYDTVVDGGVLVTNFDGIRPGEMDIDGGAFIDTFSTYAPEELLPARVFDTIDMQVYSVTDSPTNTVAGVGYRVFQDMSGSVEYLRISADNTALLTADLAAADTTITVDDNTILPTPDIATTTPGVVFINGERITYYVKDADGVTLSQLRRGTHGTGAAALHATGSRAVDGSIYQRLPGTTDTRIDTVLAPWKIWSKVVNTNAELNALTIGDYIKGATVLVLAPTAVANTQEAYTLIEISPGVLGWGSLQTYSDSVWYDAGATTPSDGLGLQGASTTQAVFLQSKPAFVP